MNDLPHLPYRPDIDGLRAVAVVAVILCHAGVPFMRGGFAGVDVFFVISGFLITQLLVPATRDHSWRALGEFFLRRARRILPALLVMMLVVTLAAAVLFVPAELAGYGYYLKIASVMLANVAGWRGGNYFDAMASQLPLLHLWSLGIEEQFYLLYPPLLWFLVRKWKGAWPLVLAALLIFSFLINVWAVRKMPSAAFYLLPFRAWELLLGALLASSLVPKSSNWHLANVLSLAGIGLIGSQSLRLVKRHNFPAALRPFPAWGRCC